MTLLISKAQYKRSEKGEFHDIAERTLDDTVSLILNYPWNTERSLASIELTCPSVTIEHPIGSYLKIGPYFSGKFSLYYLGINKKVYLKVADKIEDACILVKTFFEQDGELEGFEKYDFTINPIAHFRTNPFEYTVSLKAKIKFFNFPLILLPVILFIILLKDIERPGNFAGNGVLLIMLFFLVLCSPLIYFFFNYLAADKNSYLQISKGHDEFVFGTIDGDKQVYNKQDIAEINVYGVRNRRSLWAECEIFKIAFKNGNHIQFTSLLMAGSKMSQKFPDHAIVDIYRPFPRVKGIT